MTIKGSQYPKLVVADAAGTAARTCHTIRQPHSRFKHETRASESQGRRWESGRWREVADGGETEDKEADTRRQEKGPEGKRSACPTSKHEEQVRQADHAGIGARPRPAAALAALVVLRKLRQEARVTECEFGTAVAERSSNRPKSRIDHQDESEAKGRSTTRRQRASPEPPRETEANSPTDKTEASFAAARKTHLGPRAAAQVEHVQVVERLRRRVRVPARVSQATRERA